MGESIEELQFYFDLIATMRAILFRTIERKGDEL